MRVNLLRKAALASPLVQRIFRKKSDLMSESSKINVEHQFFLNKYKFNPLHLSNSALFHYSPLVQPNIDQNQSYSHYHPNGLTMAISNSGGQINSFASSRLPPQTYSKEICYNGSILWNNPNYPNDYGQILAPMRSQPHIIPEQAYYHQHLRAPMIVPHSLSWTAAPQGYLYEMNDNSDKSQRPNFFAGIEDHQKLFFSNPNNRNDHHFQSEDQDDNFKVDFFQSSPNETMTEKRILASNAKEIPNDEKRIQSIIDDGRKLVEDDNTSSNITEDNEIVIIMDVEEDGKNFVSNNIEDVQ